MKTVQLVIEEELLREADREARRGRMNRSAFIREALREHLERRRVAAWEEQERRAYREHPIEERELAAWQKVQAWPED
jgi:metal-responsive CopG/Arc/MetJ family transcriptional regulator